ncbi:hypothetical protein GFS24_10415 [Chitinophaga sp. SYP-B3965]|uniref:SRPBCC family protein n=1 Tax=Chitinophaga sp. SYP-B3965 TaxID=2663120 RepID=UPI001299B8C9|nr:SRPBCC domain-containing protein [Chitinophaga sp. SYP-B3965]MRG45530.1 hypothetical protein [Chitinophaga sp. SYP-B3965]
MVATDYKNSMAVSVTPDVVFSAITTGIQEWWSEDYSGTAAKVNDEFTVRFKGRNLIKMRVAAMVPNSKVTWECVDFYIDVPDVEDKKEWIGMKVFWEIGPSSLVMTHEGLTQEVECFKYCEGGWAHYLGSLKQLLDGGVGNPYKAA